jgi:hypothetical protein
MSITSKKAFIEKIKEGWRLDRAREYKRTLYYLKKDKAEIIVAISLIRKLESEGIVDSNWDVHLSGSTLIREHCRFKDAPCNYTGKGWYDRCVWCKDNNGFKLKNEDTSKSF